VVALYGQLAMADVALDSFTLGVEPVHSHDGAEVFLLLWVLAKFTYPVGAQAVHPGAVLCVRGLERAAGVVAETALKV
jgi:hypothetical protein